MTPCYYDAETYNKISKSKMNSTIRKCNSCSYETLILNDDEKDRNCRKCGGKLEIIMEDYFQK